jgi:predicted protein tyrosine phosphatase
VLRLVFETATYLRSLSAKFRQHLNGKQIICLDIPDDYNFMQPELIRLLETKAGPFLRRL